MQLYSCKLTLFHSELLFEKTSRRLLIRQSTPHFKIVIAKHDILVNVLAFEALTLHKIFHISYRYIFQNYWLSKTDLTMH